MQEKKLDKTHEKENNTSETNRRDAETCLNRGNANLEKDYYDQAISDYSKAIQILPDYADAYYSRARAYHGKGDYPRAVTDYKQSKMLNPSYTNTYFENLSESWLSVSNQGISVVGKWQGEEYWGTRMPGQYRVTWTKGVINVELLNRNEKIDDIWLDQNVLTFTQHTSSGWIKYSLKLQQDGNWMIGTAKTPERIWGDIKWKRIR